MEFSLNIVVTLLLGLVSMVSAGGLHLDFGVNLPPFVFHMPRFNLPPIKIAATFKPSTGSTPFAIKFPGISIATNQGHQQDSWWNQNQAWPEPEPEHEPYPESEPEPEPEPESEPEPEPEYHSNHHSHHQSHYDPWSKVTVKSSHKDSWASRARIGGGHSHSHRHHVNQKPQHVYMKPQSTNSKSSILSNGQQYERQKSIVNGHMAALRGSIQPSQSSSIAVTPSYTINKSPPTQSEIDSWLNQLKTINTLPDQYQLPQSMDYDQQRRSSNAHITKPYSSKSSHNNQQQLAPSSSAPTIKISNENNLISSQPAQ